MANITAQMRNVFQTLQSLVRRSSFDEPLKGQKIFSAFPLPPSFQIMSQQQVAVESGKVVEHTELVPRVSAEYIAAPVEKHIGYIFADIRDKQGNNPDEKEICLVLLLARSTHAEKKGI